MEEKMYSGVGRRLVIMGGGESGVGAALLAKKEGYDVRLVDEALLKEAHRAELLAAGITFREGGIDRDELYNADEVVKSPGIGEGNAWVQGLRAAGVPIIGEIELAFRHMGDSRIAAITGSNGKSTTTSLVYHIAMHAGLDCAIVGNIGISFARQVATDPKAWYVLEISSFQLDDIATFRPQIAVLLNITEDHLDRYDYRMENYIRSKFRIAMNQTATDTFIYNLDDENITTYLTQHPIIPNQIPFSMKQQVKRGAWIQDEIMHLDAGSEHMEQSVNDFALQGKHNQSNTLAAGVTASSMEIRNDKIREAVQTMQALEHRTEPVASIRGVEFINDSKATNINSTWYSLDCMTKPTVLILGGVDKGNDYGIIMELVKEKVKCIVCMGVDNAKIHAAFDGVLPLYDTGSAEDAVKKSFEIAGPGDVVLLSPACASFDLFKNFEDRGRQFKDAVREL